MNIIVITVLLMVVFVVGKRDISVEVNYPKCEGELKELNGRMVRIVVRVLTEKYGEMILEEFISSMRDKKDNYSQQYNK